MEHHSERQRYKIIREIGTGGMGTVLLVEDFKRGETLALKSLSLRDPDPSFLDCFKAEFEILSQLDHPNLARVYDFAEQGTVFTDEDFVRFPNLPKSAQYFFTCDYIDGRDLFKSTEGKDWSQICRLLIELCRALEYIHSKGIIHRDLKPGNILVSNAPQPQLKVLDFGLARYQGNQGDWMTHAQAQASAQMVGTLAYLAPEIIRNEPIDHRSDLYSLGIIFFRLLTRQSPFAGLEPKEVLRTHLHGLSKMPREFNPDIPRKINQLVMRLLSPTVEERPRHASDVIYDLEDALGELQGVETKATLLGYIRSGKLIGREAIVTALKERLLFFQDRSLHTDFLTSAAIVGEAGLGKKRLAKELKRVCQLQGIAFLEVQAFQADAWSEVFAQVLRDLHHFLPDIPGLNTPVSEAQPLPRELATDLMEGGASRVLSEIYRQAEVFFNQIKNFISFVPNEALVLWIHLGNLTPEHQRIVEYMARHLHESTFEKNFFLVVAYEGQPVLEPTLFQSFLLQSLNTSETAELIQSMLGTENLPAGMGDFVFKTTQGNPLHIEEVMKALAANSILFKKGGRWVFEPTERSRPGIDGDGEKGVLPEKIQQTILHRLQRLPPRQCQVLQACAILAGPWVRPWTLRDYAQLTQEAMAESLAGLEELTVLGWLQSFPNFSFGFTAAFYAQVALDLPVDERTKTLHARRLSILERESKRPEYWLMAFHAKNAALLAKALWAYDKAGHEAAKLWSLHSALNYFEEAKNLFLQVDEATLGDVNYWREEFWVIREEIAHLSGNLGEQSKAIAGCLSLIADFSGRGFEQPPSRPLRSRVFRRLGHLFRVQEQFEKAVDAYHEASRLLGHEAKGPQGALLLVHTAAVHGRMGKFAQARRECRFALRRIKGDENPGIYANALMVLGELELNRGQLQLAEEYFHRALSTYERLKDREGIILILTYLGGVVDRLGKTEEAQMHLRRSIREAQSMGNVHRVAMARNNLGNIRFRQGDYSQAFREYLGGVEAARRLGDHRLLATSLNNLGNVSRIRGEYGKAIEYYRESIAIKENLGNLRSLCHSYISYVEMLLRLGAIDEGQKVLNIAMDLAQRSEAKDLIAQATLFRALLARVLKDEKMLVHRLTEARELFLAQDIKTGLMDAHLEWCRYLVDENRGTEGIATLNRVLGFALEKGMKEIQTQAYFLLGRAEKDEAKAQAYLHLAYRVAQDSGNIEAEWESAFFLGLSLKTTHTTSSLGEGLQLIQTAQDILNEILSGLTPAHRESYLQNPICRACYLFRHKVDAPEKIREIFPGNLEEGHSPPLIDTAQAKSLSFQPDEKTAPLSITHAPPAEGVAEKTAALGLKKNLKTVQSEVSRLFLQQAIAQAKGNITQAARQTGIPRGTFYRLMSRYKVERR